MDGRLVAAREEAASRLNEAMVAADVPDKLDRLRHVVEIVLHRDPRLFQDFLPYFLDLQVERAAPVRKWLAELAEEVAAILPEHIPSLLPRLLALLKDDTAVVAKRALQSGHAIFRSIFLRVATLGPAPSPPDKSLVDAWSALRGFKSAAYTLALQPCNDGVRMHAIEFMKTAILLFSPVAMVEVPRGAAVNAAKEFDIARVAAEHRPLDVQKLTEEANENVSSLLALLQPPARASLPPAVMLVVVQSLAGIAKQRLPYYGKVVPALLALVPQREGSVEPLAASVGKALRAAFILLLRCTFHPETLQWREKLSHALVSMGCQEASTSAIKHAVKANRDPRGVPKQEEGGNGKANHGGARKRAIKVESADGSPTPAEPAAKRMRSSPVEDAKALITAANGDRQTLTRLADGLAPEVLADVVIAFMQHLPPSLPPLPLQPTPATPSPSAPPAPKISPPTATPVPSVSVPPQPPAPAPAPAHSVPKRDPRRDPRLAAKRTAEEAGILSGGTGPAGAGPAAQVSGTPAAGVPGAAAGATTTSVSELVNKGRAVRIKVEPVVEEKEAKVVPPAVTVSSSSSRQAAVKAVPAVVPLPVVPLSEEAAAAMKRSAFGRIIASQQAIATTGASGLRLSLLARLSSQVDEGAIEVLLQHILLDYANHKGHELSLQLLYHLAAAPRKTSMTETELHDGNEADEGEEGSIVYDKVLTALANGLRTSLPFNNRSLQRLLCEAPLLTASVIEVLRVMCGLSQSQHAPPTAGAGPGAGAGAGAAPADANAADKEMETNADTVTQSLTILWHLILDRPPLSSKCLAIVLECTLHEVEEYRDKACRLVSNRLYGNEALVGAIEEFATDALERVAQKQAVTVASTLAVVNKNKEGQQLNPAVETAKRCGALFFALCSKKPALLPRVFEVFGRAPKAGKAGIVFHVKNLARSAGPTPELLSTISIQPPAAHQLVLQVLSVLSEAAAASPQVIDTVQNLYSAKKDAQLLIPILSSLSKTEVLGFLPRLVDMEPAQFRLALARILQGSVHAGPALSPAEVLVALHSIDTSKDKEGAVPMKKVLEACAQCINQKAVFTAQVLKTVLSELIEQTPLPVLFMRTVIDSVHAFPSLMSFCMELLSRLIVKQVWKMPKLWTGFLKCVEKYMPHSLPVVLQLPRAQLKDALGKCPLIKGPLTAYASQPRIASSLPRLSLALLDLLPESAVGDNAAPPEAALTS